MTEEQFDALDQWLVASINRSSDLREHYLKARKLLVDEPAKAIERNAIIDECYRALFASPRIDPEGIDDVKAVLEELKTK